MKMTVGVVGLGLIGASFAKAYKENEPEAVVYGWNRTKSITYQADGNVCNSRRMRWS